MFNQRDYALNVLRVVRPDIARKIVQRVWQDCGIAIEEGIEALRTLSCVAMASAEARANLREAFARIMKLPARDYRERPLIACGISRYWESE